MWATTLIESGGVDIEQLNKKVKIIPLRLFFRNVTAGSFLNVFMEEVRLESIVEFNYNNDDG